MTLFDDAGYAAKSEINSLPQPYDQPCQWDRGCAEHATHDVVQYDPSTLEELEGFRGVFCEPHARAMAARLEEFES